MEQFVDLSLTEIALLVGMYWLAVALITCTTHRRSAAANHEEPAATGSDRDYIITFTETIPVGRFALALLPPAILVIAWIVLRNGTGS